MRSSGAGTASPTGPPGARPPPAGPRAPCGVHALADPGRGHLRPLSPDTPRPGEMLGSRTIRGGRARPPQCPLCVWSPFLTFENPETPRAFLGVVGKLEESREPGRAGLPAGSTADPGRPEPTRPVPVAVTSAASRKLRLLAPVAGIKLRPPCPQQGGRFVTLKLPEPGARFSPEAAAASVRGVRARLP